MADGRGSGNSGFWNSGFLEASSPIFPMAVITGLQAVWSLVISKRASKTSDSPGFSGAENGFSSSNQPDSPRTDCVAPQPGPFPFGAYDLRWPCPFAAYVRSAWRWNPVTQRSRHPFRHLRCLLLSHRRQHRHDIHRGQRFAVVHGNQGRYVLSDKADILFIARVFIDIAHR